MASGEACATGNGLDVTSLVVVIFSAPTGECLRSLETRMFVYVDLRLKLTQDLHLILTHPICQILGQFVTVTGFFLSFLA